MTDFTFFKRPSDGKCLFLPNSPQGNEHQVNYPPQVLWVIFSLLYDIDYSLPEEEIRKKIENIAEVLTF